MKCYGYREFEIGKNERKVHSACAPGVKTSHFWEETPTLPDKVRTEARGWGLEWLYFNIFKRSFSSVCNDGAMFVVRWNAHNCQLKKWQNVIFCTFFETFSPFFFHFQKQFVAAPRYSIQATRGVFLSKIPKIRWVFTEGEIQNPNGLWTQRSERTAQKAFPDLLV